MQVIRDGKKYNVAGGNEWFWKTFSDGSWESSTFKIFDKLLTKASVMLDIGAWIGPTALYAAQTARQVFAFEPDPVAFSILCRNIDLNNVVNVTPYPVAVASTWRAIPFGSKTGYGDSMSSEIWAKGETNVPAVSLVSLLTEIKPDFIKIDIEGGEKNIFRGLPTQFMLESIRPTIHLSLHTPDMQDDLEGFKKAIIDGIGFYPYFYDEELKPIKLVDAFDVTKFNAIVATYKQIA